VSLTNIKQITFKTRQQPKMSTPFPTEPQPNTTATASLTVSPTDLASSLSLSPTDSFPAVFATARMIALMEIASARVLTPFLQQGQLSVGVSVDVTHTAPTPLGSEVVAEARYTGRTGKGGKLFEFEVTARDKGGEIGKGRHVRAFVEGGRLEGVAGKRVKEGSEL
jgi:fluoroacetyl-CoA thioesterase